MLPASCLLRCLPQQQLGTGAKRVKKLVIQIIPICQHYNSRIIKFRIADNTACIEHHGQTLPTALRMPHYPDLPTVFLQGISCTLHCFSHRKILMIPGNNFDCPALTILENNKIPYQIQKPCFRKYTIQKNRKIIKSSLFRFFPIFRFPHHIPGKIRRDCSHTGIQAVTDYIKSIVIKQRRNVHLVVFNLFICVFNRSVFVGDIFQFK